MNTKKILVSFLLIASVLFLVATTVSAYDFYSDLADSVTVKVNGIEVVGLDEEASVIAGETISVKVKFTALSGAGDDDPFGDDDDDDYDTISDVRIKVELEGDKADVTAVTPLFDVEEGKTYTETLTLKVPSELKDELSDDLTLNVKISNGDYDTEVENIMLRVQRPSYEVAIKSVITNSAIDAGETMPVDIVLKNVGYNDVDGVYVTVSIPELNIEKSGYFGDLAAIEDDDHHHHDDDDEEETVSGRLYLEIPYSAKSGVYTLTVEAETEDSTSTVAKEITIENSVSEIAIKSGNDLVLINPTNKLKVYKVAYQSNDITVVVPAVSSKNVPIQVPTGDYSFDVSVFSGENLVGTVKFSGSAIQSETQLTNPVFVLTVILAVVFLVLLVVLIVLITKKPQKTEEFGESYY